MDSPLSFVDADAAQRFRADAPRRDAADTAVAGLLARVQLEGLPVVAEALRDSRELEGLDFGMTPDASALEALVGEDEMLPIWFVEDAARVAVSVGRVWLGGSPAATGTMVSTRLLLTNHHVLPSLAAARTGSIEFRYQTDRGGILQKTARFTFRPEVFFANDKDLDYALVAVEETNTEGVALREFGFVGLGPVPVPAARKGVNIIQHPNAEPKKIAIRENRFLAQNGARCTYTTDTLFGSSGSLAFDDQWRPFALHHTAVPKLDANGRWLKKDGTPFIKGQDDARSADADANEAILLDVIVAALVQRTFPPAQRALLDDMLQRRLPPREAVTDNTHALATIPPVDDDRAIINARRAVEVPPVDVQLPASTDDGQTVDLVIPLEIRVSVRVGRPA